MNNKAESSPTERNLEGDSQIPQLPPMVVSQGKRICSICHQSKGAISQGKKWYNKRTGRIIENVSEKMWKEGMIEMRSYEKKLVHDCPGSCNEGSCLKPKDPVHQTPSNKVLTASVSLPDFDAISTEAKAKQKEKGKKPKNLEAEHSKIEIEIARLEKAKQESNEANTVEKSKWDSELKEMKASNEYYFHLFLM